jgi:hypothetical protein
MAMDLSAKIGRFRRKNKANFPARLPRHPARRLTGRDARRGQLTLAHTSRANAVKWRNDPGHSLSGFAVLIFGHEATGSGLPSST